jgi:hypothetical protein
MFNNVHSPDSLRQESKRSLYPANSQADKLGPTYADN